MKKYYFTIIIFLAVLFSFWKLGANDLGRWDESEYGVNAFEMIHNNDWVNYYYAGKPDTWNAKPPLSIWLIALCYKIFGYNAFALRFTSAVCSILFFILAFKLVKLYGGEYLAFITCLVLLSCKSIYGAHLGRSGEMDSLLVFLLTASVYYFLLYHDFGKQKAVYMSALFLGLAFFAKGTSAFLLLPGLALYSAVSGKLIPLIKEKKLWLAFGGAFLICNIWILLLYFFGNQFNPETSYYKSHNALETLFMHDTFQRLTDPKFASNDTDYLFFISVLDTKFNIWNYIFYLSLATGIIYLFKSRKRFLNYIRHRDNRLALLSVCLILPLAILLTFATSKHGWYLAPIFLFIAIVIGLGINWWVNYKNWFKLAWFSVLLFTLVRMFVYLNSTRTEMQSFFETNKVFFDAAPQVFILNLPPENIFLYLNWYHRKPVTLVDNKMPDLIEAKQYIFYDRTSKIVNSLPFVNFHSCYKNYCLAEIYRPALPNLK